MFDSIFQTPLLSLFVNTSNVRPKGQALGAQDTSQQIKIVQKNVCTWTSFHDFWEFFPHIHCEDNVFAFCCMRYSTTVSAYEHKPQSLHTSLLEKGTAYLH